jgi:hypothetical protein
LGALVHFFLLDDRFDIRRSIVVRVVNLDSVGGVVFPCVYRIFMATKYSYATSKILYSGFPTQ